MNTSNVRTGVGIREFLEYYVLVVLDEEALTKEKIIEVIQERSSDNTQYRPGSALRVADEEVEKIIAALLSRNSIRKSDDEETCEITEAGKKALKEANAVREKTAGSKEKAVEKLTSLLDPCPPERRVGRSDRWCYAKA